MDLTQLEATIEALPEGVTTKPALRGIAAQLRAFGNSLGQVLAAQTQAHAQQRTADAAPPAAPLHPYGPCSNPQCQSCVQAAQEAVLYGRQSFMGDLDSALAWANRRDIAEIVTDLYADWERAGKPQPAGV